MRATKILGRIFVLILIFSLLPGNRASSAPATELPILVGIYPTAELYNTVNEILNLDTWLGTPTISIAGTFIDLESPEWFIRAELNASWDAGYIPFVNLGAGTSWPNPVARSASQIANGVIDTQIRNWARVYKDWSNNGEKRAMIAPLQEMNGEWNTYGLDAPNFKLAYYRIQQIFAEEGVARQSVLWVFAPNGYSNPGQEFEHYYPGNSFVDAVGFSSFNFGSCPTNYPRWETYTQIYKPYLDRLAAMAPGKPLFIAEIGTVAEGGPTRSTLADKNLWLSNTLTNLASYPGLRGWIYFNLVETTSANNLTRCPSHGDYRVYQDYYGQDYNAFKDTVTNPSKGYSHWSNTAPEVNNIMFKPADGLFEDVWPASTFSGLNSIWYADWVDRLASAGITGGCSNNVIDLPGTVTDPTVRYYCPDNSVTRAQMAVFLERGIHGTSYAPSPATGTIFTDVASDYWASAWIEQLSLDGTTGGCGQNVYCPDNIVTRAQMAVFLLKSKYGTGYTPSAATGTIFTDVPNTYWAAAWIEQLAAEGITGGCGTNIYCPDSPVTRAQMAVFLVKTFNLP